ncbi:MAG: acyl-CoA reductase [Saprospiraceae bacterium]
MNLEERIMALAALGQHLQREDEFLNAIVHRTFYNNPWFTPENQDRALKAIATQFLDEKKLREWAGQYSIIDSQQPKSVGLIMAGNIPLVGFHDLLCVFVAGHKSLVKLSDKDKFLLPYLLKVLEKINPEAATYFEIVDKLKGFDATIATGSNNSARYFEAYFGKLPHIIRKNRNSVAILDGTETQDELLLLGKDVFRYFGLGCRNVSKIYVPEGYNFQALMERLHEFRDIVLHEKYKSNFDYNYAIVMLNRTPFINNGCIILTEDPAIASRIAILHYEFYADRKLVEDDLKRRAEEIQCVVSKAPVVGLEHVDFGKTQSPGLGDYADGVDVMRFLKKL